METYEFTIIASGVDPFDANFDDRFFEAGCDDATISVQKAAIILEFNRESKTFSHALWSAIKDVEKTGATITHVEPDHLVSLTDIASRSGLTKAAISNYANGGRGKDFPAPSARVTTESPLWDWVDVARWLYRQKRVPLGAVIRAKIVRKLNVSIAARRPHNRALNVAA